MANPKAGRAEHSAEYFGETRDHWWNADWLELLGQRLTLSTMSTVLDVGCGVGHWGRQVLPLVAPHAALTGVDAEPRWVAAAQAEAARRRLRASYTVGDIRRLPFADAQFDLVTCQTVLIHLEDPDAALAEFFRVVRPGGLVLAVEPNNACSAFVFDSASKDAPLQAVLDRARLLLTCERGKVALGEGHNSVGDTLPTRFVAAGFDGVQCWLNDKCPFVHPPYATAEQRAAVEEVQDFAARDFWWWSREQTRRYFLAGGGAAGTFDELYAIGMAFVQEAAAQAARREYSAAVGAVTYVVAGRRPGRLAD